MKFYIHIGPGKTGSSAVQFALEKNIDSLKSNGIFYPKHSYDTNNISNGNAQAILDKLDGINYVNKDKIGSLCDQAQRENCSSILLSSESFYPIINELISCVPNASYVAYIRNPLIEKNSAYNQRVKRKGFTGIFKLARKKLFKPLCELNQINAKHRILLRSYLFDYDNSWNITDDLLNAIGARIKLNEPVKYINNSYSFEALELKRSANNFLNKKDQQKLDLILQGYNVDHEKFSLMSIDQQKSSNEMLLEILNEQISKTNHSNNLNKLVSFMEKNKTLSFKDQMNKDVCFENVYEYIATKDSGLLLKLRHKN
jgi:hypothetical protein